MVAAKLSTFIVAMLIVSGAVAVLAMLMSDVSTNYSVPYSDNESLVILNKLDNISSVAQSTQSQVTSNSTDNTNIIDVIGGFFQSGYRAAKVTYKSFDVFTSMTDAGLNKATLGETTETIRTVIITSVLVIIFVGIGISILVNREV